MGMYIPIFATIFIFLFIYDLFQFRKTKVVALTREKEKKTTLNDIKKKYCQTKVRLQKNKI